MTSTDRQGPVTEPVLPSSRQAMPGSEQYERELAARQARDGHPGKRERRSPAEIEADLQTTTDRLAANVDELVERLNPRQVAKRGAARARGLVTTADGRLRAEAVGAVVGALVGVVVLVWMARRRRTD